MVCHEQEPLDHRSLPKSWQELRSICLQKNPNRRDFLENADHDAYWQLRLSWGLAAMPKACFHDRYILLHSELNSTELHHYEQNFVGAFIWSHAFIARDWYRFAPHDPRLQPQSMSFPHDFNIYARAWSGTREYRLTLLDMLQSTGLMDRCRVTFSHRDNNIDYQQHCYHNQDLKIYNKLLLPDNGSVSSDHSATYDPSHYTQCGIDVVLETLFDDLRLYLTEKILRPIACAKPFVLAGPPFSLAFLRSRGFETFHDLIDESYDTIIDPVQRLKALVNVMRDIADLDADKKRQLMTAMHRVSKRNQRYFFSRAFAKALQQETQDNVSKARDIVLAQHIHGHKWLENHKLISKKIRNDDQLSWSASERKKISDFIRFLRGGRTIDDTIPGLGINPAASQSLYA